MGAEVLAGETSDVEARSDRERADDASLRLAAREGFSVELGDEPVAVGGSAFFEDVVDALELLEIVRDVIEEERVEHLAEQERCARRAASLERGRSVLRRSAHGHHQQTIGAEMYRGRHRRVEAETSVDVELAVDL